MLAVDQPDEIEKIEKEIEHLLTSLKDFVHGNFVFTEVLGHGSMGVVFLAEHRMIERPKAVKVLTRRAAESPSLLRRFFDESVAACACEHDHIVRIEDCGELTCEDQRYHYIEMEYLKGQDLGRLCLDMKANRIDDVDRAVKIIGQTADALAAAHAKGVVHRDVKPENIFLTTHAGKADFVKVLDFGVARLTDPLKPGLRTRTGEVLGTPLYMSPEQAAGHHVDGKSDVWSLGVVLYRILSGTPPFRAPTWPAGPSSTPFGGAALQPTALPLVRSAVAERAFLEQLTTNAGRFTPSLRLIPPLDQAAGNRALE